MEKLKAIVRATKADFTSPSNPASSSDEFIILFPSAFENGRDLTRILYHESVHLLSQGEWAKQFGDFKKTFGWKSDDTSRPGEFLAPDAKMSPEEVFAKSIEYFEFDPDKVRTVSPKIFMWIKQNLSSKLKRQRGCNG